MNPNDATSASTTTDQIDLKVEAVSPQEISATDFIAQQPSAVPSNTPLQEAIAIPVAQDVVPPQDVPVAVPQSDVAPSQVPQEIVQAITEQVPENIQQQVPSQPVSAEPVYHTVSGGPDLVSESIKKEIEEKAAVLAQSVVPEGTPGSLPQQNSAVALPAQKSSGGAIIVLLLILGGGGVYLYFMQPEMFQEILNQILGLVDKTLSFIG